jgi:hypothetical protein
MSEINQTLQASDFHWIETLALEEVNMDESGIVNINSHLNPTLLLEESSIAYMNTLRDLFEAYVQRFNECRGRSQSLSGIKILKIYYMERLLRLIVYLALVFLLIVNISIKKNWKEFLKQLKTLGCLLIIKISAIKNF